ncbi:MAG: cation diffusion facilitator family transporter [Clostridium sp.]|uniref:cation diffusion facilitator family transporter n=2 Tax=Bacteria TaxID=2 RepID=UPI002FC8D552
MLTNFLLRLSTKGNDNYKNKKVRNKVGFLSGVVGIIVNSLLFILKFTVGFLVSSVAVIADAFNNLSDAASSVITIVGFKLASKPADKNHPYGHGRVEYISALIIAFLVILVGFQFTKSSIDRIMNPVPVEFQVIPFILLVISIGFKVWLGMFNKSLGNKINSTSLKATATDCFGDVLITTVVVISLFASKFTVFPIDGYIGVGVSLFILYAGYNLVKDTVSPLIGEAPDKELIEDIEKRLLSYDYITGVHDLIIHNYGPGRTMASIHAEIPSNIDIMSIHEVIDKAERDISDELSLHLVIHMDPICVDDEEITIVRKEINQIIKYNPLIKSMHDFRIVGKGDKKTILFDVVVDSINLNKISSEQQLIIDINSMVQDINQHYSCIVTIDKDY